MIFKPDLGRNFDAHASEFSEQNAVMYQIEGFFACIFVSYVIKQFAHPFSCVYVELWVHLGSLEKLELLSAAPRATLIFFPAVRTSRVYPKLDIRTAKHEQILKFRLCLFAIR